MKKSISGKILAWVILLLTAYLARFHPIIFGNILLISLAVVLFSIISLCKAVFRRRTCRNQLVMIVGTVFWYILLLSIPNYFWLEIIEIKMGMNKFSSCATRGVDVAKDQRLAICEIDNRWWRYGFTTAIIYDSSHQIELSHSHRAPQWEEAARHLPGVPFGIVGFSATRLVGNYYGITFFDDQLPDFPN
jgi:hypothetical protein